MRFLVDENLSPLVAAGLREGGHEVEHVSELGLAGASDAEVMDQARADGAVLLSADTDFGTLLAEQRAVSPSVILLRRLGGRRAADVVALVLANLAAVENALNEGSVVVLESARVRVRTLPLL